MENIYTFNRYGGTWYQYIYAYRLLKVKTPPPLLYTVTEKHYRKNNPKYIIKDRTECFDDDYYFACTTERDKYAD
jgi:hypothetical protein